MRARAGSGFSLAEALVASVLVGFALLVGLSVILWADEVEERAALRVAGTELAASVAERVRAAPYGSVVSGELDLADEILAGLPAPAVTLEVEEDEELRLKDVAIRVAWQGDHPSQVTLRTIVGSAELPRR